MTSCNNYKSQKENSIFNPGRYVNNDPPGALIYRLFTPETKECVKYPLVVYLHGAGGRGDDNISQIGANAIFFVDSILQRDHPSYVLVPQCPKGYEWVNTNFKKAPFSHYKQDKIAESPEMKMIISLIDSLINNSQIDKQRIYLVGFSMGSSGSWDIITRYPDKFAASINISGVSDTTKAIKIKQTAVWAFNGELDAIAPPLLNGEMVNAIKAQGGNARHTIFKGMGHDCCKEVLSTTGLVDWLYSQSIKEL